LESEISPHSGLDKSPEKWHSSECYSRSSAIMKRERVE
jgi:hypothetical protein